MSKLVWIALQSLGTGFLALALISISWASPMTVTVIPRPRIDEHIDAQTFIYLDGEIDAAAPKRLSQALSTVQPGAIWITLNSPGGNLFAGMELGRIIRKYGASTSIGRRGSKKFQGQPGVCYSACSLAYLGGLFRYINKGSVYGVHRVSSAVGPKATDLDVGQILSAAISSYIRDMGADPGLFDLMVKAGADDIYLLSAQEAEYLHVVNNGRMPPEWSIEVVPGGMYLKGVQETVYGVGKAIFNCDQGYLIFHSVYQAGDKAGLITKGGWVHSLMIDDDILPLPAPFRLENVNGFVNASFTLTAPQLRRVISAKKIGHAMQLSREAPTFVGYQVEIDGKSTKRIRDFIENCVQIK